MLAVLEKAGALGHRHVLVGCREPAAGGRGLRRVLARHQVVPRVVRDVVGPARLVDLEQVHGPPVRGHLHAQVVAVRRRGPVRRAVRVDLAAEDADRARVGVVRRHGDRGAALLGRRGGNSRRGHSRCGGKEGQYAAAHLEGLYV